jgi:LysR family hydrogen peroxide-inducible transcriptional activator
MTSTPPSALPQPRADAAALQAFVAVARFGTVVRAAEAIGRTQPSVSARLASLEEAWSTRLFRRQARGMALTPEGARLLPRAESVLAALVDLDGAAGLPVSPAGLLRIGSGDALGRVLLPQALSVLARERAGLQVRVLEGSGPSLLQALGAGIIDVALVALESPPPPGGPIEATLLLESPVELLLPPDRRDRSPRDALAALRTQPVVTLQGESAFRRHLQTALATRRIAFHPAVEVGNLSLVRRFVSAGLGVAPVPAVAFERGAPGPPVRRWPLPRIPPVRYHRVVRSGVPLPEALSRLLVLMAPARGKLRTRQKSSR